MRFPKAKPKAQWEMTDPEGSETSARVRSKRKPSNKRTSPAVVEQNDLSGLRQETTPEGTFSTVRQVVTAGGRRLPHTLVGSLGGSEYQAVPAFETPALPARTRYSTTRATPAPTITPGSVSSGASTRIPKSPAASPETAHDAMDALRNLRRDMVISQPSLKLIFFPDAQLVEFAKRLPTTMDELKRIGGSAKAVQLCGQRVLNTLKPFQVKSKRKGTSCLFVLYRRILTKISRCS